MAVSGLNFLRHQLITLPALFRTTGAEGTQAVKLA
jgi:hypothetical protein